VQFPRRPGHSKAPDQYSLLRMSNADHGFMTKLFALLCVAFFVAGCEDSKPAAHLVYKKLHQTPSGFVVQFDSNMDNERLYQRNEEIIVKKLMCAIGDDRNFEVGHPMQYVFRGDLELRGSSTVGTQTNYHYFSNGDFYEIPPASNDVKALTGVSLAKAIGNKISVPCKLIMTVYMRNPYYSREMLLSAADVLRASNSSK
jgi:hypothetical protein